MPTQNSKPLQLSMKSRAVLPLGGGAMKRFIKHEVPPHFIVEMVTGMEKEREDNRNATMMMEKYGQRKAGSHGQWRPEKGQHEAKKIATKGGNHDIQTVSPAQPNTLQEHDASGTRRVHRLLGLFSGAALLTKRPAALGLEHVFARSLLQSVLGRLSFRRHSSRHSHLRLLQEPSPKRPLREASFCPTLWVAACMGQMGGVCWDEVIGPGPGGFGLTTLTLDNSTTSNPPARGQDQEPERRRGNHGTAFLSDARARSLLCSARRLC